MIQERRGNIDSVMVALQAAGRQDIVETVKLIVGGEQERPAVAAHRNPHAAGESPLEHAESGLSPRRNSLPAW